MNKPLRLITIITMAVLVASLLCACDVGILPGATPTPSPTVTPEPQPEDLGTFRSIHPDPGGRYDNPTENQMVLDFITKAIKDKYDVIINGEITFYPEATYDAQLKSTLASGAAIDGISGPIEMMPEYLERSGLVLPINDLLESRGQALKKLLPQEAFAAVTKDNQILALPGYTLPQNLCTFIRTDLLKELELEAPTNLDELYTACYKLRKNGYYYPLAMTMMQLEQSWLAAFDCPNDFYVDDEGKLWPKEYHPNYLKFIKALEHMYDKNYLPRDFSTTTEEEQRDRIIKGKAGIYATDYNTVQMDLDALKENAPEAVLAVLPNVTVEELTTESKININSPVQSVLMFLGSGRHSEALMVFRNWTAESRTNTMVMNYGVPGVQMQYDEANDTLQYPLQPYDKDGSAYYRAFSMNADYGGLFPPNKSSGELVDAAYQYLTTTPGISGNRPPFPVRLTKDALKAKDHYDRRVRSTALSYIEGDVNYGKFTDALDDLKDYARKFCDEIASQQ